MGVTGLFKKLFGGDKKQHQTAAINSINITGCGLVIDGVPVDMPTHISALEKILGQPRAVKYKTSEESLEYLEQVHGKGMIVSRVNYAWDDLGIYCYTNNGTVLSAFGIRLSKQGNEYKHYPHTTFKGTVTIDGRPWFDVLNSAEDKEVFRRLELDCYSIIGDYTDPFDEPESRTEKSYCSIEVNLK